MCPINKNIPKKWKTFLITIACVHNQMEKEMKELEKIQRIKNDETNFWFEEQRYCLFYFILSLYLFS